eukprot:3137961-Rhodomonas_salina.3
MPAMRSTCVLRVDACDGSALESHRKGDLAWGSVASCCAQMLHASCDPDPGSDVDDDSVAGRIEMRMMASTLVAW